MLPHWFFICNVSHKKSTLSVIFVSLYLMSFLHICAVFKISSSSLMLGNLKLCAMVFSSYFFCAWSQLELLDLYIVFLIWEVNVHSFSHFFSCSYFPHPLQPLTLSLREAMAWLEICHYFVLSFSSDLEPYLSFL